MEWSCSITLEGRVTDDALDELFGHLFAMNIGAVGHGSAGGLPTYGATFNVDAETPGDAVTLAVDVLIAACRAVGIEPGPVVETSAMTVDYQRRWLGM